MEIWKFNYNLSPEDFSKLEENKRLEEEAAKEASKKFSKTIRRWLFALILIGIVIWCFFFFKEDLKEERTPSPRVVVQNQKDGSWGTIPQSKLNSPDRKEFFLTIEERKEKCASYKRMWGFSEQEIESDSISPPMYPTKIWGISETKQFSDCHILPMKDCRVWTTTYLLQDPNSDISLGPEERKRNPPFGRTVNMVCDSIKKD